MNASELQAHIVVDGVSKVFDSDGRQVVALQDISLAIPHGQFVCLLGPSGCGKSTLLNAIAGFAPPSSGSILAGGAPVAGPGPERGMVFQEYALFPWMTVEQNVGFGLEIKGMARAQIGALTRRNLQDELLRLWAELKKTILFVTHSIEEAIYLADRIVVMTYRPGTIKRVIRSTSGARAIRRRLDSTCSSASWG